jgi:phage host-nuclease inhibitor protein Gam
MATKKKSLTTTHAGIQSPEEFTAAVNGCAATQLELESAQAALNELLDKTGADLRARIDQLTADAKSRLESIALYAQQHRAELFDPERKTADTTQADFGFADNPPKIAFVSRDWNEAKSTAALEALGKDAMVRTIKEINKDALKEAFRIAAARKEDATFKPAITHAELLMCGLKLSQTERFWLTPKRAAGPEAPSQSQPAEVAAA